MRRVLALLVLTTGVLAACGRVETARTNAQAETTAVAAPRAVAASPLPDALAMTFMAIPAGTFRRGAESGNPDEWPVNDVRITRAFEMQRTEVTQGQWEAVMGSNPAFFKDCGPTCPVENVSWDDAQAFVTKLNARTDGYQYRLPTEAEWEYAARAGTTGDYGGTGKLDEMGWYVGNAGKRTHPVAQKQPNAWGLYDMHGNVAEWVTDWDGPYSTGAASDPTGPAGGQTRGCRGGHANRDARAARSAPRSAYPPGYTNDYWGFRLVRVR
jgi:formylglycine-generating enzyme required for sulfatase activity